MCTNPTTDLVTMNCVRASGISVTTSLPLTGLTPGKLYYFRVFGSDAQASQRSGTFCFCGSTGLSNSSVLPINLNSFTAAAQNNIVTLKWNVDISSDARMFEVQRSENGTAFSTIQTLVKSGTDYEINDMPAGIGRSIIYYRLKSTNISGAVEYSKIISLNIKGKAALSINPTIVRGSFLEIECIEAIKVNIISAEGKKTTSSYLVAGHNHINISYLSNGIYYLQDTKSGTMTKFLISK